MGLSIEGTGSLRDETLEWRPGGREGGNEGGGQAGKYLGKPCQAQGGNARGGPCPVSKKTTRRPQSRGAGLVGKEDRKWLVPSGVLEHKGASGFGSDLDFTFSQAFPIGCLNASRPRQFLSFLPGVG